MTNFQQVEGFWQRFGSMINTGLLIGGALALIWKGGGYFTTIEASILTNASEIVRVERDQGVKWTAHDDLHKNRLADVKSIEARSDERMKSTESDLRKLSADVSSLTYRMTTSEQAMSGVSQLLKDIQKNTTELSGDMREFKVILQRMEKGQIK